MESTSLLALAKGRLFLSLAFAVTAGILILSVIAIAVAWQGFGALDGNVAARLAVSEAELERDLDATVQQSTGAATQVAENSAGTLGSYLGDQLGVEVGLAREQLEASLLATGDALAELLALVSRDAILGRDFSALVSFAKVANGNQDVVYVIYLQPDGSPYTRYVDRSNPKVQALLDTGEGRTPVDKLLVAAGADPSIREIRKEIRFEDKLLGQVLLGISTDQVQAASQGLQARFDGLIADSAATVDRVLKSGLQTTVTQLVEHFEHLAAENRQLSAATAAAVQQATAGILQNQIAIYLFAGVLVLLALCAFFLLRVSRPLDRLGLCMEDIAEGEGDLTRRITFAGRDEMARVAIAFNAFVSRIHQTMQSTRGVTDRVATAAEALAAVAQQNSTSVSSQQSQTQQVATAITEMAATVREIAQSAESTAESTRAADAEAQGGKRVVGDTIAAINQLAVDVETAAGVINRLASDSQAIGSVLDVIRNIAEQTNLLALNAAIEAARAGEQGRGFAVVADEVRTLASRTQESTREIRQMIENLRVGSKNAVAVMQQGLDSARRTVPEAVRAGAALDNIVANIAAITDMSNQIASAAEEQTLVAEQLDRNVAEIAHLADDAATGTQQTSAASRDLAGLGEELRGLVAQFKV